MKRKNGKRKYRGHFLFAYFKNERNHRSCRDFVLFCQLYFPFISLSLEFQRGIDTGLHEIQTLQMELDFTWFYICSFDQLHPRRRRGHRLSLIQKTPIMKAPRKLRHWGQAWARGVFESTLTYAAKIRHSLRLTDFRRTCSGSVYCGLDRGQRQRPLWFEPCLFKPALATWSLTSPIFRYCSRAGYRVSKPVSCLSPVKINGTVAKQEMR